MEEKLVYKSIASVAGKLAKDGISKGQKNTTQNYFFRGIDEVYNALAPLLPQSNLVILPRVVSRHQTERQSKRGDAIFCVVVESEFDIVSTEDGSLHTVKTWGEAMDSADKATNKAMSAAYKMMVFQTFCVPTEGDNDADLHTHEIDNTIFITDEQSREIDRLLLESKANVFEFLKWAKVESIKRIPADRFDYLVSTLNGKIDKLNSGQIV